MNIRCKGRLIPFCLTATEDSSSLYGVAYGYNTSDPTVGQLVILVKADVSAPTPISLSSLTWSLVGLIQRNKVMTAPDNSQFISACAVSSGGVFTFLSPNVVPLNMTSSTSTATGGVPGGFRYDPTITAGLPNPLTPPSTANCNSQSWNNLWRFISVDPNVGWNSTATQANTYASLFYVPKAANSNGFGSTENLVLSHLKDGTVYFAQEDNAFLLHHTGTLRTPTAYISSITTYTNYAGNFYLVGPTTTSPANMTTVLGIPIVDGYLSALPTSLKVYNSAPGSIPVGFTGGCASSQNTVLATVTLNSWAKPYPLLHPERLVRLTYICPDFNFDISKILGHLQRCSQSGVVLLARNSNRPTSVWGPIWTERSVWFGIGSFRYISHE
ncbi:hypothetical protein BGZ83_002251 [Gryganskiella cystojenkinii]|nr:hypothetical protein BGZ83_002251 [Gryganskiella cystojenkinii]